MLFFIFVSSLLFKHIAVSFPVLIAKTVLCLLSGTMTPALTQEEAYCFYWLGPSCQHVPCGEEGSSFFAQ
ncbi:hypothetical protein GOP47_0021787 [Adiantum capillus-veneris]|uniref:Secreted protein n=1 Tax=Adiantum capillus-veneris TaxID=13818 RepID=A0A9D4U8S7_ADICA|nr:hypothetical protein GOP47_0021787 [Adiantum capillus-veneris]